MSCPFSIEKRPTASLTCSCQGDGHVQNTCQCSTLTKLVFSVEDKFPCSKKGLSFHLAVIAHLNFQSALWRRGRGGVDGWCFKVVFYLANNLYILLYSTTYTWEKYLNPLSPQKSSPSLSPFLNPGLVQSAGLRERGWVIVWEQREERGVRYGDSHDFTTIS